jgi:hypothetical protein
MFFLLYLVALDVVLEYLLGSSFVLGLFNIF